MWHIAFQLETRRTIDHDKFYHGSGLRIIAERDLLRKTSEKELGTPTYRATNNDICQTNNSSQLYANDKGRDFRAIKHPTTWHFAISEDRSINCHTKPRYPIKKPIYLSGRNQLIPGKLLKLQHLIEIKKILEDKKWPV